MTIKELREKSPLELARLLDEQRDALRSARFKVHADQEKNVRSIRRLRLTVARIQTLMREAKKA